mmetsp:Transcript_10655/g.21550  ORF Transcript_10655/g.21550 Transcript_10655/m.21550 type:complete len:149 (+) Transcript_10655:727-1173(+)
MCTSTHPSLAICGMDGDKVSNCGADAKDGRPLLCCDGLYCNRDDGTCTAVAIGDTSTCGEVGDKTMDCGVGSEDTKVRPQSCCEGMYCGEDKRCALLSENPDLVTPATSDAGGDDGDVDTMSTSSSTRLATAAAVLVGCAVMPIVSLL